MRCGDLQRRRELAPSTGPLVMRKSKEQRAVNA
jgi:hypothetical protein